MNLLPAKPSSKHFISEWHFKNIVTDGTSLYSESCSREHVYGDICGLFEILSMLIFIDFLDPIIYEFKSSTKNERVLNIPTLKL